MRSNGVIGKGIIHQHLVVIQDGLRSLPYLLVLIVVTDFGGPGSEPFPCTFVEGCRIRYIREVEHGVENVQVA